MKSPRELSDELFAALLLPPVQKLEPCTNYARPINLNAYTREEQELIRKANEEMGE